MKERACPEYVLSEIKIDSDTNQLQVSFVQLNLKESIVIPVYTEFSLFFFTALIPMLWKLHNISSIEKDL